MGIPFDWIWRMPTALICAWLALAASKLKVQIRGVKVLRVVMLFLSWVLLWLSWSLCRSPPLWAVSRSPSPTGVGSYKNIQLCAK
jgi:hypothetical protein